MMIEYKLFYKYKTLFDKDEIQKKDKNVILRKTERLKEIIIKDILS